MNLEKKEEAFKVFTNIINEIVKEHLFHIWQYSQVETEIVDETFVVSSPFWIIEFSDNYFSLTPKEGCHIDRDNLLLIWEISENIEYIFAEIEKHLTNITADTSAIEECNDNRL